MGLTPELILELLQAQRQRKSYLQSMAEFMGYDSLDDYLKDHPDEQIKPRKPYVSREDRIKRVLIKRYNVPEAFVDSLINEVRDEYSDW